MTEEAIGAALVGVLVGTALAFVVLVLIGGLFLRWSVRAVQGFSPGYGRSVLTVAVASIVGIVVSVILVAVASAAGMIDPTAIDPTDADALAALAGVQAMLGLANLVVSWLAASLFTHLMIRQPDGAAIPLGRAMLAGLLYVVMLVALGLVIGVGLVVLAIAVGVGGGLD